MGERRPREDPDVLSTALVSGTTPTGRLDVTYDGQFKTDPPANTSSSTLAVIPDPGTGAIYWIPGVSPRNAAAFVKVTRQTLPAAQLTAWTPAISGYGNIFTAVDVVGPSLAPVVDRVSISVGGSQVGNYIKDWRMIDSHLSLQSHTTALTSAVLSGEISGYAIADPRALFQVRKYGPVDWDTSKAAALAAADYQDTMADPYLKKSSMNPDNYAEGNPLTRKIKVKQCLDVAGALQPDNSLFGSTYAGVPTTEFTLPPELLGQSVPMPTTVVPSTYRDWTPFGICAVWAQNVFGTSQPTTTPFAQVRVPGWTTPWAPPAIRFRGSLQLPQSPSVSNDPASLGLRATFYHYFVKYDPATGVLTPQIVPDSLNLGEVTVTDVTSPTGVLDVDVTSIPHPTGPSVLPSPPGSGATMFSARGLYWGTVIALSATLARNGSGFTDTSMSIVSGSISIESATIPATANSASRIILYNSVSPGSMMKIHGKGFVEVDWTAAGAQLGGSTTAMMARGFRTNPQQFLQMAQEINTGVNGAPRRVSSI